MKKNTNELRKKTFDDIVFFLESSMHNLNDLIIDQNQIRFSKDTNTNMYTYIIINIEEDFFSFTIQEIKIDRSRKENVIIWPIIVDRKVPLKDLTKKFQEYFIKY